MKTCAFTGHRPKGLGYPESDGRCTALKEKLRSLILKLIEEEGVTHFISGMAQGVDMYAAEIVLELKKHYPQITLECAIPYERQAVRWPEALRNRYFSIAERCDKETMLQTHYTQDCLRNRKVGLDSAAGYLGSAIKEASLRWQRGSFFFDRAATPLSQLR